MKERLTNNESADFIGCSPNTLKMSRSTGKLFGVNAPSYIKLGRAVRYKVETLEEWLSQFDEISSTAV